MHCRSPARRAALPDPRPRYRRGERSDDPLGDRSARIVAARKLIRRSGREASGAFLVEGPQSVREAVGSPQVVRELIVTSAAAHRHRDIVDAVTAIGRRVSIASDGAVASLSETTHPQGVVAVCATLDVPTAEALAGARLCCLLASVRDPGNAGTLLRCADAAGAGAVVFAGAAVDPYNGKCVRAGAGSHFHLPIARCADPIAAVTAARDAGLAVLAADGGGETDLDDLADSGGLAGPTAWLFGNEAWGLPDELAAAADLRVAIPIHGRAESLNLATAAAVCLYASARAHRKTRSGSGPGET